MPPWLFIMYKRKIEFLEVLTLSAMIFNTESTRKSRTETLYSGSGELVTNGHL